MKEKFALGTALLVASTVPVFGHQYRAGSSDTMDQNNQQDTQRGSCCTSCCDDCCPPKDPCAKCAQLWPSCGPDWIITPGAGPCTADGCDFFVTAEFLYWAVRQDHLGFAATLPEPGTTSVGEISHPDWRMELGFKVGIGWLTCIDGWDLYLNYTWLRPRTKNETASSKEGFIFQDYFLFGFFSDQGNDFAIESETAKWKLDFNVLDLEWGRNFYISKCLHLRPHFGLKGTWQEQKFEISANASQRQGSTSLFDPITGSADLKNDYWGIGPRAGLDSAWHFSRCFSVVGEAAITALWGRFDSRAKATQTVFTEGDVEGVTTTIPAGSFKTELHSVKPVMEFFLGFRWEDWWCCDEYYTGFDIGWEVQWWGGQNQFAYFPTETRWGDLGFHGLTVRARFQF